ncbi:MAG: pyruvate formate lyase family protein [Pseudomonadota bacterium]
MPLSVIDPTANGLGPRVARLKNAVQSASPGVCAERALIWTQYHRSAENRKKPSAIQMAEALGDVLLKKRITIYPDELIVGNFSSKRVGGSIYPELHGLPMMEDLFAFPTRTTNPLTISGREQLALLKIVPFWARRFLAYRSFSSPRKRLRFIRHQLEGTFYLVNESGGISHLAPDYEKLLRVGTDGIRKEIDALRRRNGCTPARKIFYEAADHAAESLARFGARYGRLARRMAEEETDEGRRADLLDIARVCARVPRRPAGGFHEALQALFFAQIAINLESLDNSVCPGRMDQYLLPFYERDLAAGILTPDRARELVAAFSIKMCEIVPVFSRRLTRFHGGMFNGQVVTVGGLTPDGDDGVNDVSRLFLDVMDALRMRQPNYHARIHADAPPAYVARIAGMLAAGSNSPALYNDDVIVGTLAANGYALEDARNYTAVGCVEPVCQGKSFSSTDAALVNVPICLELALNEGRRFGARRRCGAKTPPVSTMGTMAAVFIAFETQLQFQLHRLMEDLQAIEQANRRYHPTPLTSLLLDGCLTSGKCSTAGGARYNFSGIQCVGPADTGDALYAIERAVFIDQRMTLPVLAATLAADFPDPEPLAALRRMDKFGNDVPAADRWTQAVTAAFARTLAPYRSTRGGRYTMGLYSVTAHQHFGRVTGALPHGRKKGAPFASGIAPGNGMDRSGPTALINSVNRIDARRAANGVNFNLKLDPHALRGAAGPAALTGLLKTYFARGGMQAQVNVLDAATLREARDNPAAHPNLLVRVSGYSAYFADLTPDMQEEIIRRTTLGE